LCSNFVQPFCGNEPVPNGIFHAVLFKFHLVPGIVAGPFKLRVLIDDLPRFKPGILVAAIIHGGRASVPSGASRISEGDRVVVVAKSLFLQDLNDILEK